MTTALAIAAHPDDIEFLMAGTLMHLAAKGVGVHYFNLADGCCGSTLHDGATTAAIRLAEAKTAAAKLGAIFYPPICRDLEIYYEPNLLAKVASVIRQVAPDILLTHSPTDYMEDHTNTSRLAVSAAFARGMPNYPVQPPAAPTLKPIAVYHAQPYSHHDQLGRLVAPEFFVDVSSVLERKVALLECHASQKLWLDQSQGLDSYLQTLRDLDAKCGEMSGQFAFAEGWRRHWPLGFGPAHFDPLRESISGDLIVAAGARQKNKTT
jgi:LmbE family N-acetylglucosaminyl deacetylase